MNKYYKEIRKSNKYREFIRVLNGVLNLTEREIDILSILLTIEEELSPDYIMRKGIMNREIRTHLKKTEKMSKSNLSKVENRLKDKGVLIESTNGKIIINPLFRPKFTDTGMEIVFKLDFKTTKDETITL